MVFATSSRSSTERHEDFSESVCFTFVLGVLFGFGCWVVCVGVFVVLLFLCLCCFEDT